MVRFRAWILACVVAAATGAASAEPATRLDDKQLAALFSGDVAFTIDYSSGFYFEFKANRTWEGRGGYGGADAWGSWRIEDRRICSDIAGGTWTVGLCHGIERRGDRLFFVDARHWSNFVGRELDLYDRSVLARLQPATPPPVKAAPVQAARAAPEPVPQEPPKPLRKPPPKSAVGESQPPPVTDRPAAPQRKTSGADRKYELELQRLALERQRLETEGKVKQLQLELELERLRQKRASAPAPRKPKTKKHRIPDIPFGTYHALVIGIDDYSSLPKLKTAILDARTVGETLKELYGYAVTLLLNPTRVDIIDALDEYRDRLGEEDNLLIYYAGHGWLDPQTGAGYWLPVNARTDRRSRWVSNATLTNTLQALFAKHVMVVADSCYSGSLTRGVKVTDRNKSYIRRIAEARARVVLTSGGLEPVEDSGGGRHSVFAEQFLKALRANDSIMDGTQLFRQVRQKVVLNADQTPEYSDIRRAGHEGGDFLFVRVD